MNNEFAAKNRLFILKLISVDGWQMKMKRKFSPFLQNCKREVPETEVILGIICGTNEVYWGQKYSQPEHLFIFEKLNTWCTHNSSCFCYFWIFLNINFNKMYILIKLIYYLQLEELKKRFSSLINSQLHNDVDGV